MSGAAADGYATGRPRGVRLDGVALKARRRELGLTQAEAAELANVTRRTVAAAERDTPVSLYSARQLGAVLGLPYVALVRSSPEVLHNRLLEAGYAAAPPPSPWAGRTAETARLLEVLRGASEGVVVGIAGPSGIGKTGLARYVAAELQAEFPDGIVWVQAQRDSDDAHTLALLCDIAGATGFREALPNSAMVAPAAFARAFRQQLWRRRRLLILDDVPGPEWIERLVGTEEGRWAVITTAHRAIGEALAGPLVELGPLEESAAIGLLAAHVGEERVADDPAGAHRLVSLLGAAPGSLQIAGRLLSRERYTRLGDYAQRLEGASHPPRGGAGDAWPVPSGTMGGATAQSQLRRRLSEPEWNALCALAFFEERPFPLDWGLAAIGAGAAEARACLGALADLYLVRELPHADGIGAEAGRRPFQLDAQALRAVRHGATERSPARDRVLRFAAEEAARLASQEPSVVVRLALETLPLWRTCFEELTREVLGVSFSREAPTSPDEIPSAAPDGTELTALLPQMLLSLRPFLARKGPPEAGPWLLAALAVVRATDDDAGFAELAESVGMWLGTVRADFKSTRPWFLAAGEAFGRVGRPGDAARVATLAAKASYATGRPAEAAAYAAVARDLARAAGAPEATVAAVSNNVAVITTQVPDRPDRWQRALEFLEEALNGLEPVDEASAVVHAAGLLNREVVRRCLGTGSPDPGVEGAVTRLETLVRGDDLATYLVAAVGRLAAGEPDGGVAPAELDRQQRAVLLSVPPELVGRRLIALFQLALTCLAALPEAPALPHPPSGVESPIGRVDATDIVLGLPLDERIGHGLALIYPQAPLNRLLDGEGLVHALAFVAHVATVEHPTHQLLAALAAARRVSCT